MAWESMIDFQGAQSQKEGQEHQGTLKQFGGKPLALQPLPGFPGLPSGSGLPGIHQAIPSLPVFSLFHNILNLSVALGKNSRS